MQTPMEIAEPRQYAQSETSTNAATSIALENIANNVADLSWCERLVAELPLEAFQSHEKVTDVCLEKISIQALQALQRMPGLRVQDYINLANYESKVQGGAVDVNYTRSKKTGIGRRVARGASLATFSRQIRATLADGSYVDIDMFAAHFLPPHRHLQEERLAL
jgi:hypothetical protein